MQKLAVFMPSLDGGGAERVTVILLNKLVEQGYVIDLLVANGQGVYRQQVDPRINIIDFGKSRVASCLLPLIRYLKLHRPAALLSVMNYTNVIAILARKVSGVSCRLVLTEHNNAELALQNNTSAKYYLVNYLTKWLYRSADSIVCVSQGVADSIHRLLDIPKSKLTVIYNPVIHPGIMANAKQAISLPFVLSDGELLVIGVGRLSAQKNFPNLIKAFNIFIRTKAAKLVILGEGEDRMALQELIVRLGLEESVFLPGFVENPYAWMRRADLFALSSSWEGLPTVLIEALACGCKVVSTNCPSGPDEILEDGKWGELVPVNDPECLAEGMHKALDRDDLQQTSARLEAFSIDYASTQYLEQLKLRP